MIENHTGENVFTTMILPLAILVAGHVIIN